MSLMKDVFTGTVHSNGLPISYYDSGPHATSQHVIVLLHGTGGSAENNFWALFPMLAMRHRVVALDFQDPLSGDATGEHYADQVAQVVKAAVKDGERVHIVGYSFGAVIGALVAAQHPTILDSLTLVAGWIKTDTQQRLRNSIWQQLHETSNDALASFSVLTNFSQSFLNAKNEQEIAALVDGVRKGPDRSVKMRFNRDVDIGFALTQIRTPSLVIGCTHDQTTPVRHSKMLFGALENSRYAELNSGHGIVHERPSELFVTIDAFVRDPEGSPAGHIFNNSHA
ncbi:alpha/beta fold hydrolase [Cupriavidus sp. D384]|uniref:alpha/beta fold hydrolase n=1 Tax=Cupriavidus sp. D384 TaxID=1538095 RepID=UPI000832027D|nr:alpha/beta hydrolase [Cupriavidus sp. D384]